MRGAVWAAGAAVSAGGGASHSCQPAAGGEYPLPWAVAALARGTGFIQAQEVFSPPLGGAARQRLPLQDDSLVWVATHFMAQEHPLVAAMREQVEAAVRSGEGVPAHLPASG